MWHDVFVFVVILIIIYYIYNANLFLQIPEDDGYCPTLTTQTECVSRKSMFDSADSVCSWAEETSMCEYKIVVFSVRVSETYSLPVLLLLLL